ncbi:MAG TPA: hypothetical protein VJS44_06895 [Pyrinomonadaceae bacterium]|nr:hypothetical protein [Pyrinomonadaceae bacterium]
MKRNFVMAGVAALVFALSLIGASAKADFSGTWTLDKSKSEGLPAALKDQVLVVKQEGDKLTIDNQLTTEAGDQHSTDIYSLDGKPADFTQKGPGGAEGKGKRTAKWTADGNGADIKEEVTYETPQGAIAVDIERKWMLSADGKTLTIDMSISSAMGSQQMKRVFVKKT